MTGQELITDVTLRLGDDPTLPNETYYTRSEVLTALNKIYQLMCFLTLCLETSATFTWPADTTFVKMLNTYPDWILPLRIRISGGAKLYSNRFAELAALDSVWSTTDGTPQRYALGGFDLIGLYKTPLVNTALSIVYAQTPPPLIDSGGSSPLLQTEYHQTLMDLAIPLLRVKEGAQEWQKTLPLWDRGWNAMQKLSEYVRARNKEQGYDHLPFELARFDRSKLMEMANGR